MPGDYLYHFPEFIFVRPFLVCCHPYDRRCLFSLIFNMAYVILWSAIPTSNTPNLSTLSGLLTRSTSIKVFLFFVILVGSFMMFWRLWFFNISLSLFPFVSALSSRSLFQSHSITTFFFPVLNVFIFFSNSVKKGALSGDL